MYKCYEQLIIQSTEFLVQSEIPKKKKTDLSFESFHCRIKCNINSLSTYRIHAFSRLPHMRETLRYLNCSEMIQKGSTSTANKCSKCNLCWL